MENQSIPVETDDNNYSTFYVRIIVKYLSGSVISLIKNIILYSLHSQ